MTQTDDFLESIRQTELQNFDKATRFFTGLTIETTKDFVGSKKVTQDVSEKSFKPDTYFKIAVLTFGILILAIALKETFFKSSANVGGLIFGYCFSGIIIYTAIKQFYFNKALNYLITIDKSGVSIDEKKFLWKDIYDTAIITKGGGKYKTKYLIIVMNDMTTYEKFELTQFINLNFWGFSSTLSKYIEYFKPATRDKTTHNIGIAASGAGG